MRLLNQSRSGKRAALGRRGDITLYFILIGAILFAVAFISQMGHLDNKLQKVGENTIKVLNTFEMSERLIFYIDASSELASKLALNKTIETSGYSEETFKGKKVSSGCGILAYPIIDSDAIKSKGGDIDACFPKYEDEYRIAFSREFGRLLLNYQPFALNPADFYLKVQKNGDDMNIDISAGSALKLPVYAYIESYYRDADKTKTSKNSINTLTKTDEGYFTKRAYSLLSSFERQGITPSKIVLHDTKTHSVQETYAELMTGFRNYNYVIDTTGEIHQFASETKKTRHSSCTKGGENAINTCIMEDTDSDSISIALVNTAAGGHTREQVNSLVKLIAEISKRNPTIELKEGSVILNSEIDSSRVNDPSSDLASQKADIIQRANLQKTAAITKSNSAAKPAESTPHALIPGATVDEDGTIHTPTRSIQGDSLTGKAISQDKAPDIDESKCFNNMITTMYYTPDAADFGNKWSSGKASCPNSFGYCCIPESERGFYEDVMCQGSGVADGQVYHYTKISPAGRSASVPLNEFANGITSTGRDPQPHRTVAADANCPGFAKDSKLYIYFSADNPWNGYYVVEDTGSAFIGNCRKMDIYVGVGKKALEDASKYVTQNGKVCVLDENFEMPDADFSGSSTFVDPTTGDYLVSYHHALTAKNAGLLFEETKKMLVRMIKDCAQGTDAQKEQCLTQKMQGASAFEIDAKFCDANVKEESWTTAQAAADSLPLVVLDAQKKYRMMGTVTQVSMGGVDIFSAAQNQVPLSPLLSTADSQPRQGTTLLEKLAQKPNSAIISLTDESGTEIKINLSKDAVEWVDYLNTESILYESNLFLRPQSKISIEAVKVKNATHDGFYVFDFESISEYPQGILREEMIKFAKTISECATDENDCICNTEKTRMLGSVNVQGSEIHSSENEQISINVPFTAASPFDFDTSNEGSFRVYPGLVSVASEYDKETLPVCVPQKKYYYICSSASKDEELGTIGYALKI